MSTILVKKWAKFNYKKVKFGIKGKSMTFGQKLKNLREEMDMTQTQVAELIPMNQSNYSKIERDWQEPDLKQLKRIAEIFEVSADYLLDIKNDETVAKAATFAKKVIKLYKETYE